MTADFSKKIYLKNITHITHITYIMHLYGAHIFRKKGRKNIMRHALRLVK